MNKLINRIVPFIFLGIILVVLGIGIILLSYLLILGAIVGLILFLVGWIKEKFFPTTEITHYKKQDNTPEKPGRTFDHDQK